MEILENFRLDGQGRPLGGVGGSMTVSRDQKETLRQALHVAGM